MPGTDPLPDPPVDPLEPVTAAGRAAVMASSVDGGAGSVEVDSMTAPAAPSSGTTPTTNANVGSATTTRSARAEGVVSPAVPVGTLPGFCHTDSLVGWPRLGNSDALTAPTAPIDPAHARPIRVALDSRPSDRRWLDAPRAVSWGSGTSPWRRGRELTKVSRPSPVAVLARGVHTWSRGPRWSSFTPCIASVCTINCLHDHRTMVVGRLAAWPPWWVDHVDAHVT